MTPDELAEHAVESTSGWHLAAGDTEPLKRAIAADIRAALAQLELEIAAALGVTTEVHRRPWYEAARHKIAAAATETEQKRCVALAVKASEQGSEFARTEAEQAAWWAGAYAVALRIPLKDDS